MSDKKFPDHLDEKTKEYLKFITVRHLPEGLNHTVLINLKDDADAILHLDPTGMWPAMEGKTVDELNSIVLLNQRLFFSGFIQKKDSHYSLRRP